MRHGLEAVFSLVGQHVLNPCAPAESASYSSNMAKFSSKAMEKRIWAIPLLPLDMA
jgi:hypothetical protein